MSRGLRWVHTQGAQPALLRLAVRSCAPLTQIDDFVSWPDFVGWWPRLERQVLTPLLSGIAAEYQVRDWANDEFGTSLSGWKAVEWAPLVILEGVTSTRLAASDHVACRIWVEAPELQPRHPARSRDRSRDA